VDRLERQGLVERIFKRDDRRAVYLYLTEKAKGMRDTLEGIYHEVNGLYLSLLSPQEQQGFFGAADKICSLTQNHLR
jgi:DNA-binding MarR family transcriptional regulator